MIESQNTIDAEVKAMPKPNPNKWAVPDVEWTKMRKDFGDVLHDYEMRGFCIRGDVTREQMTTEFFERLAEFHGFKIIWGRE